MIGFVEFIEFVESFEVVESVEFIESFQSMGSIGSGWSGLFGLFGLFRLFRYSVVNLSVYPERRIGIGFMSDFVNRLFSPIACIQTIRAIDDPAGFFTHVAIGVNNSFRNTDHTWILFTSQ